jgi:DNA-directed RNA polymerase subunit RPC12/RpoP
MIKVLEHGVRKITCHKCKAKLEYETKDIQEEKYYDDILDQEEGYHYIICPDCKSKVFIDLEF